MRKGFTIECKDKGQNGIGTNYSFASSSHHQYKAMK